MAKNVKIVPDSGSLGGGLYFTDGSNSIEMQISGDTLTTSAGGTSLMTMSGSTINIDNSAELIIPVVSSTPSSAPEGAMFFNSSTNQLLVRGDGQFETGGGAKGSIGPQGPIGPKGNTGSSPIGPQGPIGPKGNTGSSPIGR